MKRPPHNIAIVGDGPAGTTLAATLATDGARVGLFARGRPAGLVVGESMLPALVPILRRLGIEDEVRAYAVHKPGATFVLRDGQPVAFHFRDHAGKVPGYAYNVPRDRFDRTLLAACRRAGATVFEEPARLERDPAGPDRVRLAESTPAQVRDFFGGDPDWIVDATGRSSRVARLLDLPREDGDRADYALFAHCEGVPLDSEGHVHMDHLHSGWCWRIPVGSDRVSVGIVVRPDSVASFGREADAQFDGIAAADPRLKQLFQAGRRVSSVVRYGNYQRTNLRGVGDGWALAGDAFGFVDPIFSSGLFLAMDGAIALARALRTGSEAALTHYERRQLRHLAAWRELISYYYDGRLFELVALGNPEHAHWFGRLVNGHVTRHVARNLTGESTTSAYSRWLLRFVVEHALTEGGEPHRIR